MIRMLLSLLPRRMADRLRPVAGWRRRFARRRIPWSSGLVLQAASPEYVVVRKLESRGRLEQAPDFRAMLAVMSVDLGVAKQWMGRLGLAAQGQRFGNSRAVSSFANIGLRRMAPKERLLEPYEAAYRTTITGIITA